MTAPIQTEHFNKAIKLLLEETFESVQGLFLDKGTSLFETLATVSAQEASIPVGATCASLAAQVKHVAFYLDVLEKAVRTDNYEPVDWDHIWATTQAVTPREWEAIQSGLRDSYQRILALLADTDDWSSEREIGGAIAMIAHSAYHLGEIRQALCTLR